MPTYEYHCPDGHDFERFYRKISDAPADVSCPVCGKPAERKLSPSGFAFKGSGFYLTDYGRNAHRGTGEPAGGAAPESAGGDKPAADAKPAGETKASDAASSKPDAKPAETKSSGTTTPSSTTPPKPDK